MPKLKLRGSTKRRSSPYPLGEIPRKVVFAIGRQIVHQLAIGHKNITGNDFGRIFAEAIKGDYKNSPLGVIDAVSDKCAWSVKTVQHKNPFDADTLRLISGRNSPDYSLGISDPRKDVNLTGQTILKIWNNRLDEALNEYDDLRIVVLVRNMNICEFALFEYEAHRYIPNNYRWIVNSRGNFEGYDRKTKIRQFTWQPHGSQFTIHYKIPITMHKFRIAVKIPIIEAEHILKLIEYKDDWIYFET